MKKPIIGITLDSENNDYYSKFPWYAMRENYLSSIYKFNAIPFPIMHEKSFIKDICKIIDGLIITGGDFDINPKLYEHNNKGSKNFKIKRTNFEINLFKTFFDLNKPILGICGGAQLINVACGGTLLQDIKKNKNIRIDHEQKNPRNETSHDVIISNKSKLHEIFGTNKIQVNSAHHQSIKKVGKNMIISAKANDNIIECIEHLEHKWCIGVQWHPEFLITKYDKKIFENFVFHSK